MNEESGSQMKKPFVTNEQLQKIVEEYPTPFHLYDEKGIRQRARNLQKAFAWNKGFKEYFRGKGDAESVHFEDFAGGGAAASIAPR